MYGEWFMTNFVIDREIPSDAPLDEKRSRVHQFLTGQGFRSIEDVSDEVSAVRGRKFATLFNVGDPRRSYHAITVVLDEKSISIEFLIDSWFSMSTRHDTAVFVAETAILEGLLQTGMIDQTPLTAAQAKRRKSDLMSLLILTCIAVCIAVTMCIAVGAVLLIVLPLLKAKGMVG